MIKSKKDILRIFLLILLAAAVVSCESDEDIPNELKDLSILTGQPCKAPCWYNLILDKSSQQEVLDTLANLSFIDSASIHSQDSYWWGVTPDEPLPAIMILANCRQPSTEICVRITIFEDKVKSISLFPNYRLAFDEVVSRLGNPNYIRADMYGPECIGCILKFSWLELPMEISVTRIDRRCVAGAKVCEAIQDGGKIPKDLEVEEITYQGAVPTYRHTPTEYDIPWPGFSDP